MMRRCPLQVLRRTRKQRRRNKAKKVWERKDRTIKEEG
jgi:hypothetical protein